LGLPLAFVLSKVQLIQDTNNQYLISSHSPTLINLSDDQFQVFRLSLKEGATVGGPILDTSESLLALHDLGLRASDLLQSNCIIWVEGPSDRIYIKRWLELISPDLREGRDFVFIDYKGLGRLHIDPEHASEKNVINVLQLNQNVIMVLDSDRKAENEELAVEKQELIDKVNQCGGFAWLTDGREIENYLPTPVVARACSALRNTEIMFELGQYEDFETILNQNLTAKGVKSINYSDDKLNYSKKFAEAFSMEDITGSLKEKIELVSKKIIDWSS